MQINQFDQDGYVVVNDIFSVDELRDLVAITDAADGEAVAILAAQPNEGNPTGSHPITTSRARQRWLRVQVRPLLDR